MTKESSRKEIKHEAEPGFKAAYYITMTIASGYLAYLGYKAYPFIIEIMKKGHV